MSDPTPPPDDSGAGSTDPAAQPPPPPPPPPGYPYPAGYGSYPAYGVPRPAANSGKSVAILVLGIVGLVLSCGYGVGVIPAIVALALAPGARREIRESGGMVGGESFIKAGVICSWVTVGLVALFLAFVIVVVAISASNGDFQSMRAAAQLADALLRR